MRPGTSRITSPRGLIRFELNPDSEVDPEINPEFITEPELESELKLVSDCKVGIVESFSQSSAEHFREM